jgi:hypothetical protein
MVINATLIVLGCALAACSAVRQGRLAGQRRMGWRHSRDIQPDRRSTALTCLATFVAVLGGASAQKHIGIWAFPITFVPLVLAQWLPVFLHNHSIACQASDA